MFHANVPGGGDGVEVRDDVTTAQRSVLVDLAQYEKDRDTPKMRYVVQAAVIEDPSAEIKPADGSRAGLT